MKLDSLTCMISVVGRSSIIVARSFSWIIVELQSISTRSISMISKPCQPTFLSRSPDLICFQTRMRIFILSVPSHRVGNSVAPRNILFQPGPPTELPLFRTANQMASNLRDRVFSFRLIDLGRSKLFGNPLVREQAIVGSTIGVLRTRDRKEIRAYV